jgi:phosphoserine aminotransferase
MSRAYNFYPGPATLPEEALAQARDELLDYRDTGISIMESSHRGKEYTEVHEEAISNLRELLGLTDDYEVLFMQGGASMQFALVPLNLLASGKTADYINSGSWATKAIKEAGIVGNVNVAADTSEARPARMPSVDELELTANAAYVHVTTNETIAGTQWKQVPQAEAPLVADMSSDILSRPMDMSRFSLAYAGAQKNLGPAGVTVVIIRKDLAEQAGDNLPTMFKYKTHIEKGSRFNTPPTFAIYMLMLTTRWTKNLGLETVYQRNRDKASKLYDAVDATDFYSGTADPDSRSIMNVTFRLPNENLEKKFVEEAAGHNLKGLKGHRSVGGIRASIYNAFPPEGVDALVEFMKEFEKQNG